MALPTITYDSAVGSNTAASGAGPGTAVTGTSATATASTTVTVDAGKDISGVATDGSAVLWVNSSAGSRHLSKITGSAGSGGATPTFTIEDAITVAGVSWAVGGKRLNGEADSTKPDMNDAKAGWTLQFTGTGTYTQTVKWLPPVGTSAAGGVVIRGDSRSSRATLNQTGNVAHLDEGDGMLVEFLIFTTSNGTNTATKAIIGATNNGRGMKIKGCKITTLFDGLAFDTANGIVEDTEITTCKNSGISMVNAISLTVDGCYIHDNNSNDTSGKGGIVYVGSGTSCLTTKNSIVVNNKRANFQIASLANNYVEICGNVIDAPAGTTPDNIILTSVAAGFRLNISSNQITNPPSGRYNINIPSGAANLVDSDYNGLYAGSGSNFNNLSAGTNDVILTADPYTSAAGADYSRNSTAGGGAACLDTGFPQTVMGSSTAAKTDIGVAQGTTGGGSGGAPIIGSKIIGRVR